MRIDLTSNLREVVSAVDELFIKQLPFACALALTRTAKDAQQALYTEMRAVWDRPTPFSTRSLFVSPATKDVLAAAVEIKDQFPSKAAHSPDEIYAHQYDGGPRVRKGIERYATTAGLISAYEWLVPGAGARLDAYGNMSRGQVAQLMSQLRLGLDPASWTTNSTRSKSKRKKAGAMFWSRGRRVPRGVWMRSGRSLTPIMLVVSRLNYTPNMNLHRVVNAVIDSRFEANLTAALAIATASAK